ncbi:hypothetical protein, partial [Actinoallomurus sp. NPDC050550]|uniref:hypothetical protein n=1 Tax=Actinoallomurus sp. NPDC050550 TaxID=3154937 RepID=UPI0033CFDD90
RQFPESTWAGDVAAGSPVIIGVVSAYAQGRWGREVDDLSGERLAELLAELDGPDDPEHPDVMISHESGWTLSAFTSGLLVWEDPEDADGVSRHMRDVPRSLVHTLFRAVAAGDLEAVDDQPWSPGYG